MLSSSTLRRGAQDTRYAGSPSPLLVKQLSLIQLFRISWDATLTYVGQANSTWKLIKDWGVELEKIRVVD
jgi:hypothetical protein